MDFFTGAVAILFSSKLNPSSSRTSTCAECVLFTSPTSFNRFVILRCPSILLDGIKSLEGVNDRLVKEERHFVSGGIYVQANSSSGDLEDNLEYQRVCVSTEDGGVISLDWPANLNLKEEHGFDSTLLLVPTDPDLLQDLCVVDLPSEAKPNGFPCKPNVTASDFYSQLLANPRVTNNTVRAVVTGANVMKFPSLNTQGISMSRIDYAPGGVNSPHIHPRANEIMFVLEGELEVGFITTTNVLYSSKLKKGDLFVFPRALMNFQKNTGNTPAFVLAATNSQFPGTQSIAAALFSPSPSLPDDVLTTTFNLQGKEIGNFRTKFAPK